MQTGDLLVLAAAGGFGRIGDSWNSARNGLKGKGNEELRVRGTNLVLGAWVRLATARTRAIESKSRVKGLRVAF